MSARLIIATIPAPNSPKAKDFYSALLGTEMARTPIDHPTHHAWGAAGVKLNIEAPYTDNQSTVLYFLVEDLDASVELCKTNGGLVMREMDLPLTESTQEVLLSHYHEVWGVPPEGSTSSLGKAALMLDPNGAQIGLVELVEWAAREYRDGELTEFHRKEQESSVRAGRAWETARVRILNDTLGG